MLLFNFISIDKYLFVEFQYLIIRYFVILVLIWNSDKNIKHVDDKKINFYNYRVKYNYITMKLW